MLVRNASPREPMCFRCLMFNLSGPCELTLLNYTAILCIVYCTRMFIYIGYWTLNIYYYC